MKIVRLVLGIAGILALFVIFVQAFRYDLADPDGMYGVLVGVVLFVAGLLGCIMRRNKKMGILAGIFFLAASVLAFLFLSKQAYLLPWAIGSAVVGVIFLVSCILMKDQAYGKMPKFKR